MAWAHYMASGICSIYYASYAAGQLESINEVQLWAMHVAGTGGGLDTGLL